MNTNTDLTPEEQIDLDLFLDEQMEAATDRYICDIFETAEYHDYMERAFDKAFADFVEMKVEEPTEPACMPMDQFIAYMLAYPY